MAPLADNQRIGHNPARFARAPLTQGAFKSRFGENVTHFESFRSVKDVGETLRTACLHELEDAHARLTADRGNRDIAVHESRKSIRRVRAWLRLLSSNRRAALKDADQSLRALRRTLGPLRDAASRIAALGKLARKRDTAELKPVLATALVDLKARKAQLWRRHPRRGLAFTRLREGLAALIRSIPTWPLHDVDAREIRRGLKRAYRRAAQDGEKCFGTKGAVRRHSWRGRVRIFLLQAQLFAPTNIDLERLKALVQQMGDENDLAQVERAISLAGLDPAARAAVRKYTRTHRYALAKRNDRRAARLLRAETVKI